MINKYFHNEQIVVFGLLI